jgi:hypothetical protein
MSMVSVPWSSISASISALDEGGGKE